MMLTSYFSYAVCCDTLKNNMTQTYYLPEQDLFVVIHRFHQCKHGNDASKYPWTANVQQSWDILRTEISAGGCSKLFQVVLYLMSDQVQTSQNDFNPSKSQDHSPPDLSSLSLSFLSEEFKQITFIHVQRSPLGKGQEEYTADRTQTLTSSYSDILHMPTWLQLPFADSSATSHQWDSLSSNAALCHWWWGGGWM